MYKKPFSLLLALLITFSVLNGCSVVQQPDDLSDTTCCTEAQASETDKPAAAEASVPEAKEISEEAASSKVKINYVSSHDSLEDASSEEPTEKTEATEKPAQTEKPAEAEAAVTEKAAEAEATEKAAETEAAKEKVTEAEIVTEAAEEDHGEPQCATYVLNNNTMKFHRPDCPSVKRMKESNREYYNGSREDLIAMGYEPCKNCNP